MFGHVASDPTVSRTIDALAKNPNQALAAISTATAQALKAAWAADGKDALDYEISAENPLILDLDATLVTAHSEKESARPTYKKGFGLHPLLAFVDHGPGGTGEPVAALLRPGNAGYNTVTDHVTVINDDLGQLPFTSTYRVGRKVLIRTDGAGGTHGLREYCEKRRLSYSGGFTLADALAGLVNQVPKNVWTPDYNSDRMPRDGAWVAEITAMADRSGWPKGMWLIIMKERPDPGAQLRTTTIHGLWVTAFVTNTVRGQLTDLELRHRGRARCEDRVRTAKAPPSTSCREVPHGFVGVPAAQLRAEPDLARDRGVGLGVDCVDATARA